MAIPAFFDDNEYFKKFDAIVDQYAVYYPSLIIILMIWSIFSNLKDQKEKSIRIPTKNDGYYNILPYIFGSITIVTSLILIYYSIFDIKMFIQVLAIGILLIITGIFFKSMSYMELKKEKLIFVINNEKQWIKAAEVKSIEIQSDKIIVLEKSNRTNSIDFLNLSTSDIEKIKKYLNTNTEISIQ